MFTTNEKRHFSDGSYPLTIHSTGRRICISLVDRDNFSSASPSAIVDRQGEIREGKIGRGGHSERVTISAVSSRAQVLVLLSVEGSAVDLRR